MFNIYLTTLGCPKNQVDSERLKKGLLSEGFIFAESPEEADIFLVNTCGFIRDAKEESIDEILSQAKKKTELLSGSKDWGFKKLLVMGCLAKRYKDELLKEIPEIDALWGVGEDEQIIEYCKGLRNSSHFMENHKKNDTVPQSSAPSFAYLKIAEGCDKKCTFCVIPSIRGKFQSISSESILKEAEGFISQGVKELILVAQDITNYGKDLKRYNLVSLLNDITAIDGDFWVRLLYLYPTSISDELLESIAENEKICRYLDIPLQHSEDRILRLMGRRGTKKEYIKLLRNIRRRIPDIALRTTFITGFPSETEEEFRCMMDFIEEMRFDRLGVFKYSKEEGTPAEKIKGQIPEKTKNRRYHEIMKRQAAISLEKNEEMRCRRFRAKIDEFDGSVAIARLYCHAPEIDGVVIINDAGYCKESKIGICPGDFVDIEITGAYDYDLMGRIIHEDCGIQKNVRADI